ncbi:hypothetical protein BaRGS_00031637 [Batillaria attramentaria]|uniref:Serpin domain-containing protein n=1 Tax=Batillaria attramentaria TaxID=370345 RepID=A0ABD0JQY2_9CAEN
MSFHKAVVEVNEEGSEAAAATGVVMRKCRRIEVIKPFVADHPFLFFIVDKRADIALFMGHVFSPPPSP